MKKLLKYGLLSLTAIAGMSFTSCSSEEDFGTSHGQKVMLTINASKDAQTRTAFQEENGSLSCTWTADDALLVTSAKGERLGVISLVDGAGNSTATFRGEVTLDNQQEVNLFYFGHNKPIPATLSGTSYELDLSAQDGSFASLAENDFMTQGEVSVTRLNGEATGNVTMMRRVAEGKFNLQLPDGLQLEAGDVVTISQPDGHFHVVPKIKWAGGGQVVNATENGTLTITKKEAGNDLYVTIFPQTLTPTFTVTKDGYIYTATLGSHVWSQETFVRNEDGTGVKVDNWTKTELPVDLGDLDNWGGPNVPIDMDDTGSWRKIANSSEGYVNNDYSLYISAGFSQPITFKANGVTNGYLYSTNVVTPSYYQWGRWLGFPAEIGEAPELNAYGQAETDGYIWSDELMIPGDLANTTDWTYCNTQYGQIPAGQFYKMYTTTWQSGWDKTMSIRAAHIYAMKALPNSSYCDPLKTNESCTFEDRCGNPCPDGWRIPTVAEMRNLIPSQAVSGSYAEVKTINGEKYAMKWVVTTNSDGVKCVRITSVKTNLSSVSVNDAIFNSADASKLEIGAYGILSNTGELSYKNQRAYVWTNASATSSSLSGNAGAALRIVFDGTKATFGMAAQDRINGCNIIPVRDRSAKATQIKPYFPSKWQLYI